MVDVEIVSSAFRPSGSDGSGVDSASAGVDAPEGGADSAGDEGSEDTGTPRISASAAGDCDAMRLDVRCFWRDLVSAG